VDQNPAMAAAMQLSGQLEAFAALGAALRIRTEGLAAPAAVSDRLAEVTAALGVDLDQLTPAQAQMAAGAARSLFLQAADLLDAPDREPGWTFSDPRILQSTGRVSMAIADVIAAVAPGLAELTSRLGQDGSRFRDVGCGVGWLALAMAQAHPGLRVTGIDLHQAALDLAHQNCIAEGLEGQVELLSQSVTDLDEEAVYDLVWFPGPFIPADVVPAALKRCARALRPGGWLVFGTYSGPSEPLAVCLADLRAARSGGHQWTAGEAAALLEQAGLTDVRTPKRTWPAPVSVVLAQRP
jgi:2-polyprenyl-3-methyl-5-hydroxy-6-metoxy-1,4-benzoquinol methylase